MSELQVLQNSDAWLLLDLPPRASATDALERLSWNTLLRRRAEHRLIFVYKSLNNLFSHAVQYKVNKDFHENTRSKQKICKSKATKRWGHWTIANTATDMWPCLYVNQKLCLLSKLAFNKQSFSLSSYYLPLNTMFLISSS